MQFIKSLVKEAISVWEKPKKHIALIYGGLSAEREVSIISGEEIIKALVECGYKVTPIDMGHDIAEIIIKIKPDVIFNALHGTYGEDGCIQGSLNILNIPYTHSGMFASFIAFDKFKTHKFFENSPIKMPYYKIISKSDNYLNDPMERPYVIKPLCEGSSIGVELIFEEDQFEFKDYHWEFGDRIIIEEYIPGTDLQVALVNNNALGVMEIRPKNRFYDYECKYTPNMAEHLMPAPIDDIIYKKALEHAEYAHNALECRGVSRVEFRYNAELGSEGLYFLELNTHPGMTPLSIVPEIAAYSGINFKQLLEIIIEHAQCDE